MKCLRRRWCAFLCLTGSNNGVTEYVRQELRAMVGARQQQVRILPSGQVSTADFEALGLSFEMPNQGKHSLVVLFLHSINFFLLSLFDNNVLICSLKLNFSHHYVYPKQHLAWPTQLSSNVQNHSFLLHTFNLFLTVSSPLWPIAYRMDKKKAKRPTHS